MKIFIVNAFIFCFLFQTYAQQVDQKLFYRQRVEKFSRIKNVGLALTALGGVALIVGLTLTASDKNEGPTYNPGYNQPQDKVTPGKITTIASFFLLGPGGLWEDRANPSTIKN